jgi:exodeoxyribonuclease VII large subunit
MPTRIGIVTSASGAVFHDVQRVLERRWPLAELVLAPAPVQGPDAVAGIVGGLESLNEMGGVELVIVARGGGSLEELWAFNDEQVARAIFGSAVPVISAVGHETDITIADYVADVRAPTPSAAAEIAVPDRVELTAKLQAAIGLLGSAVRDAVERDRSIVRQAIRTIDGASPDVSRLRHSVDTLVQVATTGAESRYREAGHGVGTCVWRLKSLDPFATLERGYAVVQKKGLVVSTVGSVKAGDALDVRVKDGTFGALVGGAMPSRRRSRTAVPDAQAPLFTMPEERA